MDLDHVLRRLKRELEELYGDRLKGVYLFGSRARGEAEADSDVDVAVVLDDFEYACDEIQRMAQMGSDISLDADLLISIVPIREAHWRGKKTVFLENVRREAVSLG
jgi:predicted nucleotidyltransferase